MLIREFSIKGTPRSSFGNNKWKQDMQAQLPLKIAASDEQGTRTYFNVEHSSMGSWDLDNACENLFAVLVNGKRWFGGSRPNIQWWLANKRQAEHEEGCSIALFDCEPPTFEYDPTKVLIQRLYSGVEILVAEIWVLDATKSIQDRQCTAFPPLHVKLPS
jgi:hypothetical protein